jgi:hypothetical protein
MKIYTLGNYLPGHFKNCFKSLIETFILFSPEFFVILNIEKKIIISQCERPLNN